MSVYPAPQFPISAVFNSNQWLAASGISSTYVTIAGTQTITGAKTFSTAPIISSISNIGVLTLPTTTGTLALVSQIPTNANYVDLTTAQSVGGTKTYSSPILEANGTASLPSYSFTNNTGTGLYLINPGFLGFSISGSVIASLSASDLNIGVPLTLPVGTAAAPSTRFSGDLATGIYQDSVGSLKITANGTLAQTISSSGITIANALTVSTGGVISTASGSAGAPAFRVGSSVVGMWSPATDQLAFGIASTQKMLIATGGTTCYQTLIGINGTASAPSFCFQSDTQCGMFRSAAGEIGLSCGGQRFAKLNADNQQFVDKASQIQRVIFNSSSTSGDVVNFYQTAGSTATYWYYNNSNAYGTICDEKVKKNIRDIDRTKASDFIKQIATKKYELTTNNATNNGFIAQDLQAVSNKIGDFSQVITTDHDDGMLGVAHNELLAVLIAAVQNLISRVEALESVKK